MTKQFELRHNSASCGLQRFSDSSVTISLVTDDGDTDYRDIEIVDSYKRLRVHLNDKLDWTHNSDALYMTGQSRLYLLRTLPCFRGKGTVLRTFYSSMVTSAVFYGMVCSCRGIMERGRSWTK